MIVNIDEQKKFASEHRFIAENFIKYRNLNRRYYAIVMNGFIKAVKRYFMYPELQRYNFSAIALYAMKNDLYHYRKKQLRQKRNAANM